MKKNYKAAREYYTIDLLHIVKTLWQKIWLIVLSGVIAAGIGFSVSAFMIEPEYSASIMLYINNSSFSLGNTSFSISSSEITAAQSLVKTYGEILNNRTTLERVIEKADVPYTYKQLKSKIQSGQSNNTEIMRVDVTTNDPYEAAKIANCIAEVLPVRISEIIDGASMEVVDAAVPNLEKVSPSITQYTAIGLILGVFISVCVFAVGALMDDTIHDEEYILQNTPILEDDRVLLPLVEVSKILVDTDELVSIHFTNNHILFDLGNTKIISRLLEGNYVPYTSLLPQEHKILVSVNKQQLQNGIERASLMAKEGNSYLIKLDIKNDEIIITSNSQLGKVREEVSVELQGEEIEIAFNSKYLLDVLKNLEDETIYMEMTSSVSPCVIRSEK